MHTKHMKVLIVYDSAYGNTAEIAWALKKAIEPPNTVTLSLAKDARTADLQDADLLAVGSPTQGGRPTQPVQDYINSMTPTALSGKRVVAFDTRFAKGEHGFWLGLLMRVIGFASPRIAKGLQAKGGELVMPPLGFIVEDKEGPLKKYELEHAAAWMQRALKADQ